MKKIITWVLSGIFCAFILVSPALATVPENCDSPDDPLGVGCASESGLTDTDPRILTVRLINFALTFLGIIAVCLMMYAGFTWMTAGGNDEKVGTAKKIMYSSVVGFVIIMVSYSISSFILRSLCRVTESCGASLF